MHAMVTFNNKNAFLQLDCPPWHLGMFAGRSGGSPEDRRAIRRRSGGDVRVHDAAVTVRARHQGGNATQVRLHEPENELNRREPRRVHGARQRSVA